MNKVEEFMVHAKEMLIKLGRCYSVSYFVFCICIVFVLYVFVLYLFGMLYLMTLAISQNL